MKVQPSFLLFRLETQGKTEGQDGTLAELFQSPTYQPPINLRLSESDVLSILYFCYLQAFYEFSYVLGNLFRVLG